MSKSKHFQSLLFEQLLLNRQQLILKVLNDDALLDVLTDRISALQAEENPRLPYLKEQLSDVEKKIKNILAKINFPN